MFAPLQRLVGDRLTDRDIDPTPPQATPLGFQLLKLSHASLETVGNR